MTDDQWSCYILFNFILILYACINMSNINLFQVSARWDLSEACRPSFDEAPILYPTFEVFMVVVLSPFFSLSFVTHIMLNLLRNLRIHLVTYQRYVKKQSHLVCRGHLVHLVILRRKVYGKMLNFLHDFSKLIECL